jgi:hypothetical protein
MVISPQNARLGLTSLTKRVGLMDRPDSSDGELIRYRVCSSFLQSKCKYGKKELIAVYHLIVNFDQFF